MGRKDKANDAEELGDEVDLEKADEANAAPGRPIGHVDDEEGEPDGNDEQMKGKGKKFGDRLKEAFKQLRP